jgi:hypothetical protein
MLSKAITATQHVNLQTQEHKNRHQICSFYTEVIESGTGIMGPFVVRIKLEPLYMDSKH